MKCPHCRSYWTDELCRQSHLYRSELHHGTACSARQGADILRDSPHEEPKALTEMQPRDHTLYKVTAQDNFDPTTDIHLPVWHLISTSYALPALTYSAARCGCRGKSWGAMAAGSNGMVSWDPSQQGTPDDCIRAHMPQVALSAPLPLRRDVEERITSLGPASLPPHSEPNLAHAMIGCTGSR